MKHLFATAVMAAALFAVAAPAVAATCSARHKVCLSFCEKQYKSRGATSCTSRCATALPQCLQSGCWVTPMDNKCGFTKS